MQTKFVHSRLMNHKDESGKAYKVQLKDKVLEKMYKCIYALRDELYQYPEDSMTFSEAKEHNEYFGGVIPADTPTKAKTFFTKIKNGSSSTFFLKDVEDIMEVLTPYIYNKLKTTSPKKATAAPSCLMIKNPQTGKLVKADGAIGRKVLKDAGLA